MLPSVPVKSPNVTVEPFLRNLIRTSFFPGAEATGLVWHVPPGPALLLTAFVTKTFALVSFGQLVAIVSVSMCPNHPESHPICQFNR